MSSAGVAPRPWIAERLGITGGRRDAEHGQALVRLVLVPLFGIYIIVVLSFDGFNTIGEGLAVLAVIVYAPVSVVLFWHIVQRPGYFVWRRMLAMFGDYGAMTLAMAAGGMTMLPVYATLLWVTVGNGMRFGSRYLLAATCMALAAIAIATIFNAQWRAEPFVVVTLVLTTLIVPAYIDNLQRALRGALDEARAASQAKSNFLAQASHDLRQPIHAISLFTACLRDAGLGREERQMVENIDRSLHSVAGLFRSLLDIATLDSGKVEPKLAPVCVGDVIADVVRQYSEMAQWADVDLRAVPCGLVVRTDAALLSTMLQNIVSNALKYAPEAPVLIGCRRRGGRVAIEVHDRGPGIPEDHLGQVFDEFYQVRERGDRDVEGVGLGLSIVRRVGGLMGLEVGLRSTPGRGTSVVISGLEPCRNAAKPAVSATATAPSAVSGLRVLLIEDDEDVLLATATLLQKWGCVVEAQTGIPKTANAWDVMITDYDLGGRKTGADCILAVRKLVGRPIPAIIVTGHDETRVQRDLGDDTVPILAKPVRPAELRSVLTTEMVAAHH
ncbi:hybrid sensor histidine kinase/response regulator [Nitratireductor sp. ZSWI3]|uniref:hybrid sensor histidine kinase/response regulator n=1 Tax=Nitratireductor sp. ZSWI3 TaxID=2966359 RepID=UPI00214F96A1|nr:hybrid sensor histidine kinase/response regulator [Nitratireductor sp. ZSWI3]MCR4266556.1 ATP-binding protein [Nitratireductor sp. ZSWI3]